MSDELALWHELIEHGWLYGDELAIEYARRLREAWTAQQEPLFIIFDGPPGPEAGCFIEVETAKGKSVRAGEWSRQSTEDEYWQLGPFYTFPPSTVALEAEIAELKRQLEGAIKESALHLINAVDQASRAEAAESNLLAVAERVKKACATEAFLHSYPAGNAIRSLDVQQIIKEQP